HRGHRPRLPARDGRSRWGADRRPRRLEPQRRGAAGALGGSCRRRGTAFAGRLGDAAGRYLFYRCGHALIRVCSIAAVLLALCLPAQAAGIVAGLSTDLIQITSSFTGTDFVLFGAIDPPRTAALAALQDLVVVIRGPALDMTVRRKERVFGIWVNR